MFANCDDLIHNLYIGEFQNGGYYKSLTGLEAT